MTEYIVVYKNKMRIDGIELELDEDESLTCNSSHTQTDSFVVIQRQEG